MKIRPRKYGKLSDEMYESSIDGIYFVAGRWPLDPGIHTVVFIHGSGRGSVLWSAQVDALADTVNTVALDLPGHGDSAGPGMDEVGRYAEAVDAFISSLGAHRPVSCGLSLGGAITLYLLLEKKGRYAAGIVVNSGARLRVLPLILETIERDYGAYLEGATRLSISEKTDPSLIAPLMEATAACPPGVTLGDFRACDAFDVMDRLGEIDVPVLVLTASEDKMTPPKHGAYMADHIKRSTLVNIEDAGHLSPMEQPEAVTRAIRDFTLLL